MSIFPNGKLPIDPAAQAYYIRAAQIRAQVQAAHEAKSRKLMAQEIAKAIQATQSGNGASGKPYLSGLNPEQSKADAREYMARLVCYVWCMIPEHKSKDKACDYVFQSAKDGDRLYADCNHARHLLKAYKYNPNTIKTEAATLHAALVTWRKKTDLEWPDNWRDLVKKSKAKEAKSAKQRKARN